MTTTTNLRTVPFARRFMTFTWGVVGIAVLVAVVSAVVQPSILVDTLVTGGMWALMAGGLALVFGVMNIPNFAHGEFFMIGSLVAFTVVSPIQDALLENPESIVLKVAGPFPGMIVAAIVGFACGVLLEVVLFRPLRKRSRDQWVMNTFLLTAGVSVVLVNGNRLVFGNDFRGISRYWDVKPIELLGVPVSVDRAMVFVIAVIVIAIFAVFLQRTQGKGVITQQDVVDYGITGPNARASGVALDLRRSRPYSVYPELDFEVVTEHHGDVFDRYRVRMDEMRESLKIIEQCLDMLPNGPVQLGSLRAPYVITPPPGSAYVGQENPRGEYGTYIESDGSRYPYRLKFRDPCFCNLQLFPKLLSGNKIADAVAISGSIDLVLGGIDR